MVYTTLRIHLHASLESATNLDATTEISELEQGEGRVNACRACGT